MLCNSVETNSSKSYITAYECYILQWVMDLTPNIAKSSCRQENIGTDDASEMHKSKFEISHDCVTASVV
jgi:hypothetical protein